jgi:hypothetical protein
MARRGKFDFGKVARKIERMGRNVAGGAPSGLRVIAELVLTDIKAARPGHGVPIDQGPLRDSGQASGPDDKGVVTVSFGGPAAPYALRQHEELSYRHTVGEARYLVRGFERFKLDGAAAAVKSLRANARAGIRAAAKR